MRQLPKKSKRVVIKIGASILCSKKGCLEEVFAQGLFSAVQELRKEGKEAVLVSSGAIALGMDLLGFKSRPKDISSLQAAASVGQVVLMNNYQRLGEICGIRCGQVLLTWDDFSVRHRYLNARATLERLLALGVLPIINENDTIATDEIKFGDNDRLSALVAELISASFLVILSDVDGLLDGQGKIISVVEQIDEKIKCLALPTRKHVSVGGMLTKLEAAEIATNAGIACLILNGDKTKMLPAALRNPYEFGTLFLPVPKPLAGKKRWLAFSARSKGKVYIDKGASEAIRKGKSLLSVGVVAVEGEFNAGDIVSVVDADGREIARGKVEFSSRQVENIKGKRGSREVVHCDNLVVLDN